MPSRGAAGGGGSLRQSVIREKESAQGLEADTDDDEEEVKMKSLQLKTDPRFLEIKYYSQDAASSTQNHFQRLCQANRSVSPDAQDPDFDLHGGESAPKAVGNFDERVQWQRSFDRSVKRLLIDFELTDVPSCRLNHLERMHTWFTAHGAKQQRKAQKAPRYLIGDQLSGQRMPGSARDLPQEMSRTSQMLATTFVTNGRVPRGKLR